MAFSVISRQRESRRWRDGVKNFGYAAGAVTGDAMGISFEQRLIEWTCKPNGLHLISVGRHDVARSEIPPDLIAAIETAAALLELP